MRELMGGADDDENQILDRPPLGVDELVATSSRALRYFDERPCEDEGEGNDDGPLRDDVRFSAALVELLVTKADTLCESFAGASIDDATRRVATLSRRFSLRALGILGGFSDDDDDDDDVKKEARSHLPPVAWPLFALATATNVLGRDAGVCELQRVLALLYTMADACSRDGEQGVMLRVSLIAELAAAQWDHMCALVTDGRARVSVVGAGPGEIFDGQSRVVGGRPALALIDAREAYARALERAHLAPSDAALAAALDPDVTQAAAALADAQASIDAAGGAAARATLADQWGPVAEQIKRTVTVGDRTDVPFWTRVCNPLWEAHLCKRVANENTVIASEPASFLPWAPKEQ